MKYGGRLILGSLEDIKGEVIVSLTRGAGLNIPRLIVFMILTQTQRKRQLSQRPISSTPNWMGEVGVGQTLTGVEERQGHGVFSRQWLASGSGMMRLFPLGAVFGQSGFVFYLV